VALSVNGDRHEVEVADHHTLLDMLRDELGLTGTKECCVEGECGACTVLLDGSAVDSCLVLAAEAQDHEVTTIEGLARGERLAPLQDAFLATGAIQCGFCIPGMIMAGQHLLDTVANPTDGEIREGLSGNLCRCGGYQQIREAVAMAAARTGGDRDR
jgi:carbon-monoxide dehydrogenase small subunit